MNLQTKICLIKVTTKLMKKINTFLRSKKITLNILQRKLAVIVPNPAVLGYIAGALKLSKCATSIVDALTASTIRKTNKSEILY